ncbi:DCC1-like thiol-disulfide oxidoreductase family protein [Dioscorea alata]|uniref:DCC1-like thiol-disulfide oxidoreductase family protein n=1 Tax=Dioscorea alata TaxID=55571 RepID=A0ACB7UIN9_DIOAL|nr:DCC1-like thiol-disulfide oxidoreductase family protein [Dioscorea alata]
MASRLALLRLPLRSPFHASSSSIAPPFLGILPSLARHPPRAFSFRVCSVHSETKVEPLIESKDEFHSSETWKIKMLYDGECPLCMREVNMLKERNKAYGAIKFVDISSNDYSPKENQGLDYETVMGRIHAILADGTVVRDVEAFRRLYEVIGLGWVYVVTKYEPIKTIANVIYSIWAKHRLQITENVESWRR